MSRNFYVVEFQTAEGRQVSRTFATIRVARKQRDWYAAQTWCVSARVMRGGQGALEEVTQ